MKMDEVEKLKAENDALRKRMEKLEEQVNPKPFVPMTMPRRDLTEGASMPASAMLAMIAAIPESVMRGIRADALKPNPITGGATPSSQPSVQRGSGWRDAAALSTPYVSHVDRLVDAQDRNDKVELARKLAQARLGKGETA